MNILDSFITSVEMWLKIISTQIICHQITEELLVSPPNNSWISLHSGEELTYFVNLITVYHNFSSFSLRVLNFALHKIVNL